MPVLYITIRIRTIEELSLKSGLAILKNLIIQAFYIKFEKISFCIDRYFKKLDNLLSSS
jgi:hypothetical protein